VSERDTGAAGTDVPALPHDPDIPALTAATKPAGTSARAALIQEARVLVAEL
jgi:hypothetical protein